MEVHQLILDGEVTFQDPRSLHHALSQLLRSIINISQLLDGPLHMLNNIDESMRAPYVLELIENFESHQGDFQVLSSNLIEFIVRIEFTSNICFYLRNHDI